ncbi:beta carbonic anhydrase 5, chloroplastic isoform X3 [Triticum aestivum]|uniref:beta carbonic anhydrase 5, chloroplastic isoform X3 n=1 Tax=Triticum aestivum TaxID=4565 RepID=UPI001D006CD0|nr:beta carbonic anhydrase 5, chloroplastic-like isoform X3 [Triticum aestivum]
MLPWSLRSAARRLAAATRAAGSAAVAAPAPWQERPPAVEDREERAAVWEDDHWPRRRPRRSDFSCTTKASTDHSGLTRQLLDFQHDTVDETDGGYDPFSQLKERFTDFKQRNYVENFTNYQKLAEQQTPEFMVVACADSRVCPTSILGLQPGDAFTVRNVANLVPPYEHGASETTAALEFAVNSLQARIFFHMAFIFISSHACNRSFVAKYPVLKQLCSFAQVPNVLVVGHSRCGGIQALMSMKSKKDDRSSRTFIRDWVSLGKSARLSTEAAAGNLSFESQCRHCEKESINSSLLNLLTYPWIEERVKEGNLNLHGGYYNFIDCTFEKWTLVYRPGLEGGSKYAIKNRSTWS